MSMGVEENDVFKKKSKRSKKKETSEIEKISADVNLEQNLELEVKKKKKNKGKHGESYGKFDTENEAEKVKKKKKKKRDSVNEEGTDCLNTVTTEEASKSLRKKEKKLKKKSDGVDVEQQDKKTGKNLADFEETENTVGKKERKKNRKRMLEDEDNNEKGKKKSTSGEDVENSLVDCDMLSVEKVKGKKRKKESVADKDVSKGKAKDTESTNKVKRKREKATLVDTVPENAKPNGKQKKVRFSQHVEVFPSSDIINSANKEEEKDDLIRGKRFSREEDKIILETVEKYIESHGLGDKGMEMVMHVNSYLKSHPHLKDFWKELGATLPKRPLDAVRYRAHVLCDYRERVEWTEEQLQMLHEEHKKHGNNWVMLAKELNRHRFHIKDTWRRIKEKRNRGSWSQEEYQNLFDLVNIDLRAKVNEEKKSKYGMLRDNVAWTAISDRLAARSDSACCVKWYSRLSSPMVAEGIWADSDDYRLIGALYNLDSCCVDDVDWDNLIDERPGDVCRKRWDQMVLHIGLHGTKSFAEQVEVLAKRYRPELLEAREAWENKPLVP